ncbi:MAG TPA: protein kinase [Vicinamibacterales bacterium]|nr:protein kinase [Vicinamibacterales bacterium]
MALSAGTRLGSYEILAPLGSGGMGEVYKARDTRLNRSVAIKVLPAHLAVDPDAEARFVREGRAVASLSHPNLIALFDVGTDHGVSFAVMELLDGDTLRARLQAGPLPVRKALDYAAQIARGLAAAHDKGIVHRDLKPENLFVTTDGHVKILDFGLARHDTRGPASDLTTVQAQTIPGTVLGTAAYMAPEQVRGLVADARADIFAFGVVLYEMIAGRRAFARATTAETMTAILNDDPPALPADRDVPPALERVVHHCLEKVPGERFHSASDLAFQLETLLTASGRQEVVPLASGRRASRGIIAAGAVLLAGIAVGWIVIGRLWPIAPTGATAPPHITVMTYSGTDYSPAVAPDGRTLAFVSGRDGRDRIWLRQIATGEEAALTDGDDEYPRFSPDGATILFTRGDGKAFSLYRVPVLGGPPRKVVADSADGDWSPDGTHVAFVRERPGQRWVLGVARVDGSEERLATKSEAFQLRSPRWSPDGQTIAVARLGLAGAVPSDFLLFEPASLNSRALAPPESGGLVSSFAWSRRGDLVYAQNASVTTYAAESRMIAQAPSGRATTLASVPDIVLGLDLAGHGSAVMDFPSMAQNLREFAWTPAGLSARRWLTRGSSADRQPAYTRDGDWVAYSSPRSGNIDLWLTSTNTGAVRRLTDDRAEDWDPGFTRDGSALLWSSNRSGHFEIWIAEPDGRNARQLSHDGADAENPTATPDGTWIVYACGASNPQRAGVWKIRQDGSGATRIVSGSGAGPEVSPDGDYVVYHTFSGLADEIRVVRLADGSAAMPPVPVMEEGQWNVVSGRSRWRPDGHAILFVNADEHGRTGLYMQDFVPGRDTTSTRRQLLGADGEMEVESFGIAPDGSRLTVSFYERRSALMRIDGLVGIAPPWEHGK